MKSYLLGCIVGLILLCIICGIGCTVTESKVEPKVEPKVAEIYGPDSNNVCVDKDGKEYKLFPKTRKDCLATSDLAYDVVIYNKKGDLCITRKVGSQEYALHGPATLLIPREEHASGFTLDGEEVVVTTTRLEPYKYTINKDAEWTLTFGEFAHDSSM